MVQPLLPCFIVSQSVLALGHVPDGEAVGHHHGPVIVLGCLPQQTGRRRCVSLHLSSCCTSDGIFLESVYHTWQEQATSLKRGLATGNWNKIVIKTRWYVWYDTTIPPTYVCLTWKLIRDAATSAASLIILFF